MALTVCIGSFYLVFFIYVLMKNSLMFVALKYSDGKLEDMFKLMILFDLVIFFTLPLLMLMGRGVC